MFGPCIKSKTKFDDKVKAKFISVEMRVMRTFHFEMHKNSWFPFKSVSILGIGDWRLKTYTQISDSYSEREFSDSLPLIVTCCCAHHAQFPLMKVCKYF